MIMNEGDLTTDETIAHIFKRTTKDETTKGTSNPVSKEISNRQGSRQEDTVSYAEEKTTYSGIVEFETR